MYRSIVLPLDGSAFAEHAIPYAVEIARLAGAILHPVHVYVPDEPWRSLEGITPYQFEDEPAYEHEYERKERSAERAYLERVDCIATEHDVSIRPEILDGPVEDAVERHVERVQADLVVMATHGRGPLERAWLGSVADKLVRQSTVPVLLVRPHESGRMDLRRQPVVSRVLIPLDGSTLGEQVLESATGLGRLWKASCMLLSVVRPSHDHDAARAYLEGVAHELSTRWPHVEVRVVEGTDAGSAILKEADASGADLVAVSTHGHGGLTRLVLGSVVDQLTRGASMPVLVRRPAHQA